MPPGLKKAAQMKRPDNCKTSQPMPPEGTAQAREFRTRDMFWPWLLVLWIPLDLFTLSSCAPKKYPIYQAPHMGAEYQFDQGMHPPKHKLGLFNRKMRKSMQQEGMP